VSAYSLMGIVNVTPDSFSDGGLFLDARAAVEHGLELVEQGARILDIGGESTRPGAQPVDAAEELRRVLPVVGELSSRGVRAQISIDTSKAAVARAALDAGASFVNDVSALRADPQMAGVVADAGAQCCLMHMLGEPRTMQREPRYEDVVDEVKAFLEERLAFAVSMGIDEHRVLLDPGIGFGKTVAHNLALLQRLDELADLGRPIVIGTSRKSFLGRIAAATDARGPQDASDRQSLESTESLPWTDRRLPATIATNVIALERGASVFRVHDVAVLAAALAAAAATLSGKWMARSGTSPTS
jgi:dihydropteroate synthase